MLPLFCCFPGRRISEEEMRKAKEPEKPKVDRDILLDFLFSSLMFLVLSPLKYSVVS